MKNKILSLALAIFCVNFQFASAGEGEEFSVHRKTGPETFPETRPANDPARWDLQQRLRQDEPNRLRFSRGDEDSSSDSGKAPVKGMPSTIITGDLLDKYKERTGLSIDQDTLAIMKLRKDEAPPLAIFDDKGVLLALKDKRDEVFKDSFLMKIKKQVQKEQAKYQKKFKDLNDQQRQAEVKSFEILNTELREIASLKQQLSKIKEDSEPVFFKKRKLINDKEKEIANVEKSIKKLISQMDKVISKLSGRGIGGKFITPEEEAKAEEAIKQGLKARTPEEIEEIEEINRTVLPRKLNENGLLNQNPEIVSALLKAFKQKKPTDFSDFSDIYDVVDSVLMEDPEITAIARSRKADHDPKSKVYRADSTMLKERVQLVAQEAKSIFDQLRTKTMEEVVQGLKQKDAVIREGKKPLSDDDINALDRLAIDLAICDAYKPKYDVLQKDAQETALAEARENTKKEALKDALKAIEEEITFVFSGENEADNESGNESQFKAIRITNRKIAESLTAALGEDQSAWPADVRQAFEALQDPKSFTSDQFGSFVRERERLLAGLKSAVESALSGKEPTVAPEQVVPSVVAGERPAVVEPEVVDRDINLSQQFDDGDDGDDEIVVDFLPTAKKTDISELLSIMKENSKVQDKVSILLAHLNQEESNPSVDDQTVNAITESIKVVLQDVFGDEKKWSDDVDFLQKFKSLYDDFINKPLGDVDNKGVRLLKMTDQKTFLDKLQAFLKEKEGELLLKDNRIFTADEYSFFNKKSTSDLEKEKNSIVENMVTLRERLKSDANNQNLLTEESVALRLYELIKDILKERMSVKAPREVAAREVAAREVAAREVAAREALRKAEEEKVAEEATKAATQKDSTVTPNERRLRIEKQLKQSKKDEASLEETLQEFEKERKIIEENAKQRIAQVAQ